MSREPDSIADLFERMTDEGWLVTELCQPLPELWNCVLRIDGHFSSAYGTGKDALSAIAQAMGNRRRPTNWRKVREDQESARERIKPKNKRERL